MNDNQDLMPKYKDPILPTSHTKLELSKKESNSWNPLQAGEETRAKFEFQHILRRTKKFIVDLKNRNYLYREWDLTGILCSHRVTCIGYNNLVPKQLVYSFYSKETWESTYRPYILPVKVQDQWEKTDMNVVLAPQYSRGGGRAKKKRNKKNNLPKNPYKGKRKYANMKGRNCGAHGHISRSCEGTTTTKRSRPCDKVFFFLIQPLFCFLDII